MKVIRAEEMGFCFGVRRAVDMMEEAVRERGPMVSLGSVVHNPQVVNHLRDQGLGVIRDVSEAGAQPVALTAHGVGPEIIGALEGIGVEIVDTTCPIVTRSQQWAKKLTDEGYGVLVFGDPNHKEVRGVVGWAATGKIMIVPREDQLGDLPAEFPSRIGVLSQTTETEARFSSFVKKILETNMDRISELRVINTLCHATTAHQAAVINMSSRVDLMIVVGGRESANTRHLADVAREYGVETYHIESSTEIDPAWLKGRENVGVTAGASTPDSDIDDVVHRLEELGNAPVPA